MSSSFHTSHVMPSTRSQSQSQSQSLPLSIISTSSTAVLPRSYEIYLALPTSLPLSSSEQATHHVKAQEMLTDAWRRLDEPEGDLLERRRMLKIGRGGGRGKGKGKEKQKDAREPLWYNATLLHPCTCTFYSYRHNLNTLLLQLTRQAS